MSWDTRAAWYGYPTPAAFRYWSVTVEADDPHPVAEGIV